MGESRKSKVLAFQAKGAAPQVASWYRELLESLDAIFWRADAKLIQFSFVSKQAETILGYPAERWITEPNFWRSRIHLEDRHWAASLPFKAAQEKRTRKFEYRMIAADGRVVWVRHVVNVVLEDARVKELTGAITDITERKQGELTIAETKESLRALADRLVKLQDEERRRIARELHDSTAQDLAALTTDLARLGNSIPAADQETQNLVLDCLAMAEKCARDIRTLSYLLHPPLLDQGGLSAALVQLTEGFSKRSGIRVHLDLPPHLERLPPEAETTLFRVVQESLNNINRHSGSPTARIRIVRGATQITLEVQDEGFGISSATLDGSGPAAAGLGVGILGMRERLEQLGGTLDIFSGRLGTTITAVFPIPKNE